MPAALDYETPATTISGSRYWSAWVSWPLLLACVYLPYCWLLLIDYPWNSNRLLWLTLWPALPGLLVGALAHARDAVQLALMMGFTAAVVGALLFAFRRPRRRLVVLSIAALVLALSCLNSRIAYALFRM